MSHKQQKNIKEQVKLLAQESLQRSEPSGWFDHIYQQAGNDANLVPWAKMQPYPYFHHWLNQLPPNNLLGLNSLVIGCGLGDDAEALANLGIENITAFDISPHAIAWCKKRFPNSKVNYVVADLFNLNAQWNKKFDFVYECRNIQALPLNVRTEVIINIANLVANNGILLVINYFRDHDQELTDSPPWPLSKQEFDLFKKLGLKEKKINTYFETKNNENKIRMVEYIKSK